MGLVRSNDGDFVRVDFAVGGGGGRDFRLAVAAAVWTFGRTVIIVKLHVEYVWHFGNEWQSARQFPSDFFRLFSETLRFGVVVLHGTRVLHDGEGARFRYRRKMKLADKRWLHNGRGKSRNPTATNWSNPQRVRAKMIAIRTRKQETTATRAQTNRTTRSERLDAGLRSSAVFEHDIRTRIAVVAAAAATTTAPCFLEHRLNHGWTSRGLCVCVYYAVAYFPFFSWGGGFFSVNP